MLSAFLPLRCFKWEGLSPEGTRTAGMQWAYRAKEVRILLERNHITIIRIQSQHRFLFPLYRNKMTSKQVMDFTRQLTLLLQTGITLTQALHMIEQSLAPSPWHQLIVRLKTSIESGISFTHALQKFPHVFDAVYCRLIAAGEHSGTLINTLHYLMIYLQQMYHFKSHLRKTMRYPMTILSIALVITGGLLWYALPQFNHLYAEFNAPLPRLTRIVISWTENYQYGGLALTLLVAMIVLFRRYLYQLHTKYLSHTHTAAILRCYHWILLNTPGIRDFSVTMITARWSYLVAAFHQAGIPLIQALDTANGTIANVVFKKCMDTVRIKVHAGQPLFHALQQVSYFPSLARQMIAIGEQSGRLSDMLNHVAVIYQAHLDDNLDSLSKWLEPVIMLAVAVIVGTLIMALYLPLFQMGSVVM